MDGTIHKSIQYSRYIQPNSYGPVLMPNTIRAHCYSQNQRKTKGKQYQATNQTTKSNIAHHHPTKTKTEPADTCLWVF